MFVGLTHTCAREWGVVTAVCVRERELEVREGHNLLSNFHGNDEAERQTKRETDPLPTDLRALEPRLWEPSGRL